MSKFSITMSDDLGDYVHDAMEGRKFDNVSEYFRHLVRQDRERQQGIQELRALIDEGLKSGVSERSVDDIWAEAVNKAQVEAKVAAAEHG